MKVLLWGGPEDGRVVHIKTFKEPYVPDGGPDRGVYLYCPRHPHTQFEWRPVVKVDEPEESE